MKCRWDFKLIAGLEAGLIMVLAMAASPLEAQASGLPAGLSQSPICGSVVHHGTPITSSETWSAGIVHVLDSSVTVNAGVTLTIQSGAVVKAKSYASLTINGKLIAVGTGSNPVYFTSWKDDDLCGDTNNDGASTGSVNNWGYIEFGSGSDPTSSIQRAVIRYGGLGSYYSGGIRLNNVTPALTNITFSNNNINAAELVSGTWTTKTLNSTTVVYWINNPLTISAGNTLTILPGVKLKFSAYAGLLVNGKLVADGVQASTPITFTSVKDDSVFGLGSSDEQVGDTNNDGASTGAVNNWGYIEFGSGSDPTSIVQRAVIRYGGFGSYYSGGIRLNNVTPALTNITFSNNNINAAELVSGTWTTKTLNSTTVVYWINNPLTISAGNTLTILPGVKLKFSAYAGLLVNGKLVADGVQASTPITFTSVKDDSVFGLGSSDEQIGDTNNDGVSAGAVNNWGYIEFGSGSDPTSIVQHAVIRYGGFGSYYSGGIRLNNVTPALTNITFSNNNINAAELVSGTWTTKTLNSTTVVYWINNPLTISAGNTLTILPGVKLKFSAYAGLLVNGKLVADGVQASTPITFTSVKDDSVFGLGSADEQIGDTNNDGVSAGAVNNWGYIEFGSGSDSTSIVQHAVIRYGGFGSYYSGAIRINNVSPTIAYVLFKTNNRGLEVLSGARPALTCNDFVNNQDYGIYNGQPTTHVTAVGQWWGSVSGPTHISNSGGTGDRVTDGIDFNPWSTTACTSIPVTYSISGRVVDGSGTGISGVSVSDGGGHTVATDGNGDYTLAGISAGTYTITPSKNIYNFSPSSRTVTVPPDASGQGFSGSLKAWTLIYYFAADNDADQEYRLSQQYALLGKASANNNVNTVAFWDGIVSDARYDAFSSGGVTRIMKGELNTGDPTTLEQFVTWAQATYPANHYALIISDHGSGVSGVAFDYHIPNNGMDNLTPSEIKQALSGVQKLDIVYMDACLMGTIESMYQLRGIADYYVGSESVTWGSIRPDWFTLGHQENGDGWQINIPSIGNGTSSEQLALAMAQSYAGLAEHIYNRPSTISVVNLGNVEDVRAKTSALADLLKNQMSDLHETISNILSASNLQHFESNGDDEITDADEYVDLYHFASQVQVDINQPAIQTAAGQLMTSLDNFTLYQKGWSGTFTDKNKNSHTWSHSNSHGVSIFFPSYKRSFYKDGWLDFAAGTTWDISGLSAMASEPAIGWGSMLVEYVNQTNPTVPDNPNPPPLLAPLMPPSIIYLPIVIR